ncbi:MAG: hypothetical protein E7517_02370 [Ruminococcaceae bacterium]|nr:hypothetical protein [Oscillospiraceae bacterium]
MSKDKSIDTVLGVFEPRHRELLSLALGADDSIREIRIRKEKPIVLVSARSTYFLHASGQLSCAPQAAVVTSSAQVESIFARLCHYSVYSYQQSLNACFLTLQNGSRVGVAAEAVLQKGEVAALKGITALNFRIVRPVQTAAREVLEKMREAGLPSTVIVGAPCSGKTTLLRDMCRLLSSGYAGEYRTCCLIDERGELAAVHNGVAAFDVGINTDVLSYFPKAVGILNALRTLSPDWIIADEIGSVEECRSIVQGLNSGVKFLVSLHAATLAQARQKEQFCLLAESGDFGAVVCLGSGERLGKVTDFLHL